LHALAPPAYPIVSCSRILQFYLVACVDGCRAKLCGGDGGDGVSGGRAACGCYRICGSEAMLQSKTIAAVRC
jgi:hypothetical protein